MTQIVVVNTKESNYFNCDTIVDPQRVDFTLLYRAEVGDYRV